MNGFSKVELDILECAKSMMIDGSQLGEKETGEYEKASLRPPYRFIALMFNSIFGRENGRLYKLSWIPLMYYVAFDDIVFNWADIISSSLSSCIAVAHGGMDKRTE